MDKLEVEVDRPEAEADILEDEVDKLEAEADILEVGMETHRTATEADKLEAGSQQQLKRKKKPENHIHRSQPIAEHHDAQRDKLDM